jgi:hypothetical protein
MGCGIDSTLRRRGHPWRGHPWRGQPCARPRAGLVAWPGSALGTTGTLPLPRRPLDTAPPLSTAGPRSGPREAGGWRRTRCSPPARRQGCSEPAAPSAPALSEAAAFGVCCWWVGQTEGGSCSEGALLLGCLAGDRGLSPTGSRGTRAVLAAARCSSQRPAASASRASEGGSGYVCRGTKSNAAERLSPQEGADRMPAPSTSSAISIAHPRLGGRSALKPSQT